MDAATSCAPMGHLEYVVESRGRGEIETWFVVRPHQALARTYESLGVSLSPGCRVVVEAGSLRPVGVLPKSCPVSPLSAGFNPYFDLPAA